MLLKPRKNRKGFTLIELIVVVAILAILAAVAVPNFIGLRNQAKDGAALSDASTIVGAINVHNAISADIVSTTGWANPTWADYDAMKTALGDLAPAMTADQYTAAKAKVWINQVGVAMASNATPTAPDGSTGD